jgi:hypothetical protein
MLLKLPFNAMLLKLPFSAMLLKLPFNAMLLKLPFSAMLIKLPFSAMLLKLPFSATLPKAVTFTMWHFIITAQELTKLPQSRTHSRITLLNNELKKAVGIFRPLSVLNR